MAEAQAVLPLDFRLDMALLLGAGFSRWAAGLPVASELFDFSIRARGPREHRRLAKLKDAKAAYDISYPDGVSEEFVGYALRHGGELQDLVEWYIARRCGDPFLHYEYHAGRWRRHSYMIDDPRVPRPGSGFLRTMAGAGCCGIITTNYDMLVEYALTSDGFNYGEAGQVLDGRGPHALRRPAPLTGSTPLAKLHGSISWDRSGWMYSEGRRSLTGGALIVAPQPEKEPPARLCWVWDLAAQILEKAQAAMVFGFAFNAYDSATLELLNAAGSGIKTVLLVDIDPPMEGASAVWPRADILSANPPPEGDATIRSWLQSVVAKGRN